MHILITGGAGFIGSHLTDKLLEKGHEVSVLDNLSHQVHGGDYKKPQYLNAEAKLLIGDVRNSDYLKAALKNIDAVYHFAASAGVGQSMYRIVEYVSNNHLGTAVLLQALIENPVEKLIVASSMSIYGEGSYMGAVGTAPIEEERKLPLLELGEWEIIDKEGNKLIPIPTPETKTPHPKSIYALSKYDQEKMCLLIGESYNIPTVALRFFNVFGTRQALNNPYTGAIAIFASRLLNNREPLIYEDGLQQRDFVSVYDVAQACLLALESKSAVGKSINIGSGTPVTVSQIATTVAKILGREHLQPIITNKYRTGDIRHCFADISLAKDLLGYQPSVTFESASKELSEWLIKQNAVDKTLEANNELNQRGLIK